MHRLLIVDDLPEVRLQIASELQSLDAELLEAGDGAEALEAMSEGKPDLVLADVRMPGLNGLDLLRALRELGIPAMLHSGYEDVEAAMQAVRLGALDFFRAPIDFDRLRLRVQHCLEQGKRVAQTLVGTSHQTEEIRRLLTQLADGNDPVLISGEAGVGKEVVARALHRARRDPSAPLELLQGGSVSIEGPNWNAVLARVGEGTLLIDEVAAIPRPAQGPLARLLKRLRSMDGAPRARIVATTRRELSTEAGRGTFDEDLWYELCVLHIPVPPLRERPDDITDIATRELERLSQERAGRGPALAFALDEPGHRRLRSDPWPGNVRELEITLRRMAIVAGERRLLDAIDVDHALKILRRQTRPRERFEASEREELTDFLNEHGWNVSATARALGKDRGWLRRKMTRLGLD